VSVIADARYNEVKKCSWKYTVGYVAYRRSFPTRLLYIGSTRMVVSLLHTDLIGWYAGTGN
jgi:hypothetical protein